MTQYAYPASDITTGWTPSTGSTHYGVLDEGAVPDDGDYVSAPDGTPEFEVKFGPLTDPTASDSHVLRFRAYAAGSGQGEKVDYELRQGGTTIASVSNQTITRNSFNEYNYTLSAAEADSITDYTDLRIYVIVSAKGNGETIEVSWASMECPDAAAPVYNEDIALARTDSVSINVEDIVAALLNLNKSDSIELVGPGNRYWVGGPGNWNDAANHWSDASNGTPDSKFLPDLLCDVFIDSASGFDSGGAIYIDNNAYCHDFRSSTGFSYFISGSASRSMGIYGSLELESGLTIELNSTVLIFQSSAEAKTISQNGAAINTSVYIGDQAATGILGGSWTLQSDFIIAGSIDIEADTFDANGHNVEAKIFYFYGISPTTPTILMGSGTWTATGDDTFDAWGGVWIVDEAVDGDVTITPEASTIKFTDAGSNSKTLAYWTNATGKTYNDIWLTGDGTGNFVIQGTNTFNDFKVDTPPHTLIFEHAKTTAVTTWTVQGTAGNIITLDSDDSSNQFNLSKASGVVSSDYLDISNSNAAGGATWFAGVNSSNTSNNSGWIFQSIYEDSITLSAAMGDSESNAGVIGAGLSLDKADGAFGGNAGTIDTLISDIQKSLGISQITASDIQAALLVSLLLATSQTGEVSAASYDDALSLGILLAQSESTSSIVEAAYSIAKNLSLSDEVTSSFVTSFVLNLIKSTSQTVQATAESNISFGRMDLDSMSGGLAFNAVIDFAKQAGISTDSEKVFVSAMSLGRSDSYSLGEQVASEGQVPVEVQFSLGVSTIADALASIDLSKVNNIVLVGGAQISAQVLLSHLRELATEGSLGIVSVSGSVIIIDSELMRVLISDSALHGVSSGDSSAGSVDASDSIA